MFNKMK